MVHMSSVEVFENQRPYLFSVAYRMLGSVVDAEDCLQDAFLRWRKADTAQVMSPRSFLVTVVTRLCIDRLRAQKSSREEYIGPWLPEPVLTDSSTAGDQSELSESLSIAFLVLLESLSPVERAVYLMREIFRYEYAEIADVIEKSESNTRRIFSRSKQHLETRQPRFSVEPTTHQQVFDEFMSACQSGDLQQLVTLLADDVVLYSDGGGKVAAARRPILGPDNVSRLLLGILKKAPPEFEFTVASVNGRPGVVAGMPEWTQSVMTADIVDGKVQNLYVISNPDKLVNVDRQQ